MKWKQIKKSSLMCGFEPGMFWTAVGRFTTELKPHLCVLAVVTYKKSVILPTPRVHDNNLFSEQWG